MYRVWDLRFRLVLRCLEFSDQKSLEVLPPLKFNFTYWDMFFVVVWKEIFVSKLIETRIISHIVC